MSGDSTEVWSVSASAASDFPLVLGGFELSTEFSIDVPFSLLFICEVVLDCLGDKLVVGKGPVGVGKIFVDTDFSLSLV